MPAITLADLRLDGDAAVVPLSVGEQVALLLYTLSEALALRSYSLRRDAVFVGL